MGRAILWTVLVVACVASPSARAEAPPGAVEVTYVNGQTVQGHLVSESEDAFVLELSDGGRVTIPRKLVRTVKRDDRDIRVEQAPAFTEDRNRSRYLLAPSAHMLKRGELFLSQKELVFTSLSYGITDHLTVHAGGIVPFWLYLPGGLNGVFGVKAGTPLTDTLSLSGGIDALVLPGFAGPDSGFDLAGQVSASLTLGDRNRHLTIGVGVPMMFNVMSGYGSSIGMTTTFSGNLRVHERVALLTEHWFTLPALRDVSSVHAFGIRSLLGRLSIDFGAIWWVRQDAQEVMQVSVLPIPWLDFTWNFDVHTNP